jgi:hypothetical protein
VRVNLRLPADTHAIIKRIAGYQGIAVNQVVQQTVEGMRPQLDQLAATLDQSETVQTVEEAADVLGQLRVMADHARSQADRLDGLVTAWQQGIRDLDQEGPDAGGS